METESRIEPGAGRAGGGAAAEGGDGLSYRATLTMAAENGGQNRIISRRRAPDWQTHRWRAGGRWIRTSGLADWVRPKLGLSLG